MRSITAFTLIELMIVVMIIGILATIAYPSYINYLYKGTRAEAMAALLDIANRQEQFYADNHQYTSKLSDIGVTSTSASGLFILLLKATDTSFTATATPIAHPATSDSECMSFQINEIGQRTAIGSADNKTCWNR